MVLLVLHVGTTYGQSPRKALSRPKPAAIRIDRAWLAARRPPYVLDRPGQQYVLVQDVVAEGTAFVVAAEGVVLDLDGHRVVYGDGPAVEVPNGGFEEGRERDVPGWELARAPGAIVAPNENHLFGTRVLRLKEVSTPQRIMSGPVTLPRGPHTYAATITPAHGTYEAKVVITVVDADNSRTLASAESRSVERGFACVAHFSPGSTRRVRLVVDVAPPPGKSETIDLDGAAIFRSYDYGILATRTWSGELPGWSNLPPQLEESYRRAARLTVRGGKVVQGRAGGYGSYAFYADSLPGLVLDGDETHVTGMDSGSVLATQTSGEVIIRRCTFRETIAAIGDRMRNFASLALEKNEGSLLVEKNTILGSPQVGILLGFNGPKSRVIVRDNEVRQRTVVTNGYGITLVSLHDFEIAGNRILPENGRGLNVDGYSAEPTRSGSIHDNEVDVQEGLNREEPERVEVRALRLRNNVDEVGPHRDLKLTKNTFTARARPGAGQWAFGGWISYENKADAMDDAGIVIEQNTFRAISESSDEGYRAYALMLDPIAAGIHPRIVDNLLESNDVSLGIGGPSGGDTGALTLVANVLRKATEGPKRPYSGIAIGYDVERVQGVSILDSVLEKGATTDIRWWGTGVKEISLGRMLVVTVLDASGHPVAGANVTLGAKRVSTGAGGRIEIPLVRTRYRQTGEDPQKVVKEVPREPDLRVSAGGRSQSKRVPKDGGREVRVQLK
jgi:hypothetical protein